MGKACAKFVAGVALVAALLLGAVFLIVSAGTMGGCASSVKVEPAKSEASRRVDDNWTRTRIILPPKGEVYK